MSDENGTITSGAVNVRVARMPMIGWPMLNSAVHGRPRVGVVQRRIAVDDLERLPDPHADDARCVETPHLFEDDRLRGHVERVRRIDSELDVDEDVLNAAAGVDERGLALDAWTRTLD